MLLADLPDWTTVELTRDEREWHLTYALATVDLRMRITHVGPMDPDECACDVRPQGAATFVEVGRCFFAPIEHTTAWPDYPDVEEFPAIWRAEFLQLARLWGELTAIVEVAPALGNLRMSAD